MAEVEVEERAASPLPGEVGYAERVRAARDASPKPSTPQEYNLTEAAFWRHRHVPAGSVIEFTSLGEDGASPEGLVALQVLSMESDLDGIWLEVRVLGAEHDEVKKDMQKYFKSNRRQVHLCEHTSTGQCKLAAEPGWHLTEFKWYPAGDYVAPFLSAHARKKVKEGPRMEMEATGRSGRKSAAADNGASAPPSLTEKRLDALRGASRRVTFGDLGAPAPSSLPPAGGPDGRRAGILRKPGAGSAALALCPANGDKVKTETIDLTSSRDRSESASRRRKRKSVGVALAKAAATQQQVAAKKEKSRSGKKKKKKRRKKRKSSDEEDTDYSSSSESSSLLPPLKRRSQKEPGSVLRLLEAQAYEFLAKDGVVDALEDDAEPVQRPKLVTYYQLALRPAMDPHGRDSKELALLCRSLDLLREGKLDALADLLAARLIAVETATRQGWPVARHLEIATNEEEGTAPAHILLAAQRHGKQVEKAGGKGSWSRATTWVSEWHADPRPKGKGKDQKGKGKKGKAKGKGGKNWAQWGQPGDASEGKKATEGAP